MTDKEQTAKPASTDPLSDVPEVEPKRKLIPVDERGLRNAIRSIIYESFDDEAVTIADILYAVRHHDHQAN
jgi:hypothetical protein